MLLIKRLAAALSLAALSASALAATTTFTSSSLFMGQVAAGSYTNNFNGMADPIPGSVVFGNSLFSYSATANGTNQLILGYDNLSVNEVTDDLVITFLSGNVTAVGGNFFASTFSGDLEPGISVTIKLDDGTELTLTPADFDGSFAGFTSTTAISSLTVNGVGGTYYATIDDLIVGEVPEPASLALAGLAIAGLAAARRRQAA